MNPLTKTLVVATLAACMAACATIEEDPTPWQQVCTIMDCTDIQEPTVVVSEIVGHHMINLMGVLRGVYYPGEQFVFVRAGMSPEDTWATSIHEIVHYVGLQLGIDDRCESEQLARDVTFKLTGVEPGNWRGGYGCELTPE